MANLKFTEIPAWTYEGKEPSKFTFFESVALSGLEGVEIRLNAATQKKLLGSNVFGNRAITVSENGTVDCTISCDFGRDFESSTYSAEVIQQAAITKKQLRPGWSGPSYYEA